MMLSRDVNGTRISRVPKKFPVPGKKNSQTRILGKCTVAYWSAGDIILQRLPAQSVWSAPADAFICTQMLLLPPLASLTPIQTARWAVYRRWSTMTGVIRNRIKQSVIKSMQALLSPLSCSSTIDTYGCVIGQLWSRPKLNGGSDTGSHYSPTDCNDAYIHYNYGCSSHICTNKMQFKSSMSALIKY